MPRRLSRKMAQAFIRDWCLKSREAAKAQAEAAKALDAVDAFAWRWYAEIVEPSNNNPRNIKRVLEKDVIPAIGKKQIADVTVTDILAIIDRIKARGADHMALQIHNVLKQGPGVGLKGLASPWHRSLVVCPAG